MKYKLKPENRPVNEIKELITCRAAYLSLKAKVKARLNIVNHIKLPVGICFLFNSTPSLFAKVSFLIKRVLLAKVTIDGTPNNVVHATTGNRSGILSVNLTKVASENPVDIPNQNTKLQKRSLVSHLSRWLCFKVFLLAAMNWVKSCITDSYRYLNYYYCIITKIDLVTKQIIILGTFILLLLPNVAEAATKSEVLKQIRSAEKEYNIPSGLLVAIAKTESNLEPYALNIRGRPIFPIDKNAALIAIQQALDSGISNIDIGVSQLNYKWHRNNFSNLETMLSPESNIKYAARFLLKLKQEHGDWHTAIRQYHSSKPRYYRQYSRKVVMYWLGV